MKTFGRGIVCFVLLFIVACAISVASAESLQAETFVPQPGLRIFHKGILGSDGTRYDGSLITARLDGDALATCAEETLTYYEYNHEPKFSVNNFDKAD